MAEEADLIQVVAKHDDGTVTVEIPNISNMERFAALVAAAEREKFCSVLRGLHDVYSLQSISAIRARGQE
jgi:hypothetical protein